MNCPRRNVLSAVEFALLGLLFTSIIREFNQYRTSWNKKIWLHLMKDRVGRYFIRCETLKVMLCYVWLHFQHVKSIYQSPSPLSATSSGTVVDYLCYKSVVATDYPLTREQIVEYFQTSNLLSGSHEINDHTGSVKSRVRLFHPSFPPCYNEIFYDDTGDRDNQYHHNDDDVVHVRLVKIGRLKFWLRWSPFDYLRFASRDHL